jgi:hypothetical protein
VAIYRMLQEGVFGPDEIKYMTSAYEDILGMLRLKDRQDPITEIIAKKVIEITQRGERDPKRILDLAIKELGIRKTE